MQKIILTFGMISGLVTFTVFVVGARMAIRGGSAEASGVLGYLIMLVALSVIFFGIKRYRDRELGGVIRFGKAFLVGLGISAFAGVIYVISWEIYLKSTDYTFIGEYTQAVVEGKRAAGMASEELEELIASMKTMEETISNPLFRLPIAFLEIFPFALIISLISAALLRNSKFLPASARDSATP